MSGLAAAAASKVGVNARQGSHQGAQKSTITKLFFSMVSLKFALVNATTAMTKS
jgi:hypothetical protein